MTDIESRHIISGSEWYPLRIQEGLADDRYREALRREFMEFSVQSRIPSEDGIRYFSYRAGYWLDKRVLIGILQPDVLRFRAKFAPFMDDERGEEIEFDNLINLCIMVKDAGDGFRDILIRNRPYIDRWTILDTGSSDNTIAIIREVLGDKWGTLYEEPFINFRESRNRLLDLAGDACAFNVMLDDTYVIHGDLRGFLHNARGDDVAESFTISIDGGDTLYSSNRITKPDRGLRYENVIHEIIEINLAVLVPFYVAYIEDVCTPEMTERTKCRKQNDIDLLIQMTEDDPSDVRPWYYLGDSYLGLKEWQKSFDYFKVRVSMCDGFDGERQDAMYYVAALADKYLGHPWEECHQLWLAAYNAGPTRGDSLYFIAEHYLDAGNQDIGIMYLKKAFALGMPEIQMSVRKDIYQYHIPSKLIPYCFNNGEYDLGIKCCETIMATREDEATKSWNNMFRLVKDVAPSPEGGKTFFYHEREEEIICFVSPDGWSKWDGDTLREKGLGGSENFTIRYAETLTNLGYAVVVLCNTERTTLVNGVTYMYTGALGWLIGNYKIKACIVNRHEVYATSPAVNGIDTYLVFHDTFIGDRIILKHPNVKKVCCISEWQRKQFAEMYPCLADRSIVISYGVDYFPQSTNLLEEGKFENNNELRFIYPSFPNRGLLPLLQMFPKIVERYPHAKLDIFCDMDHEWTQKHHGPMLDQIKVLLSQQRETVTNHGWVNRPMLREFWSRAHVWLYPCIFEETCCLTAYEAAASRTLVISNHLAALQESVGDRGVVISGNPREEGWQILALNRLFNVLDGHDTKNYIARNFQWSRTKSHNVVVEDFANKYLRNETKEVSIGT
jgi:glycosyltransferase involved in cell wall biosynthesis